VVSAVTTVVVLVGSRRALAKAVRTQGAGRRYTALTERLQQRRARTVAAVSRAARLQQVPVELKEPIRDRVRPAGRSG
jgi:nicotinamide mononucleotide adenylyltransferase